MLVYNKGDICVVFIRFVCTVFSPVKFVWVGAHDCFVKSETIWNN